jgi:hypothetical protein
VDIVSFSPLRVASIVWQPRPGAWMLTAVCKATYQLLPMESRLVEDQDELTPADGHWNDDETRSLRAPSDLAPFKARADIVLVGHAHAPQQQPVASLTARLIVGEIDKSIEVFCDRAWTQEGQLREGARFTRMLLCYERAAGGPDSWNPVGLRADARPDRYGMVAIPNLQPPGIHVSSPGDRFDPVGFGPIAPTWPGRTWRLPRHATDFSHRSWQDAPLPEGMDGSYFNVAPADQQVDVLRSNERIILENLHPEHPRLSTSLPGGVSYPRAIVERGGSADVLPLRCDTLVIDADRGRCTLTWRGQVPLEHPNQPGRVSISMVGAVAPRRGPPAAGPTAPRPATVGSAPPAFGGSAPPARRAAQTLDTAALEQARAAMPFPQGGGPAPAPTWSSEVRPAAGLPFGAPVSVQAPPVIAPPLVRPPVSLDPVAPAISGSPWAAGGDAQQTGMSVGQLVASQQPALAVPPAAPPSDERSPDTARPAPTLPPEHVVSLLWFDPKGLPRIRKKPRWRKILDDLEDEQPDPDLDGETSGDAGKDEDRRDVFAVLVRGEAADALGIREAVTQAIRRDGSFVEPLVLLAGELRFLFDEQEAHTERMLLEQRRYQKRTVLGKPWIRAIFVPAGSEESIPAYLPEALAAELPMFQRFQARLVAELHLQLDQFESHPNALKVAALARVTPIAPARR